MSRCGNRRGTTEREFVVGYSQESPETVLGYYGFVESDVPASTTQNTAPGLAYLSLTTPSIPEGVYLLEAAVYVGVDKDRDQYVSLYHGAAQRRWAMLRFVTQSVTNRYPVILAQHVTLPAGIHTFSVNVWTSGNAATIQANTGSLWIRRVK